MPVSEVQGQHSTAHIRPSSLRPLRCGPSTHPTACHALCCLAPPLVQKGCEPGQCLAAHRVATTSPALQRAVYSVLLPAACSQRSTQQWQWLCLTHFLRLSLRLPNLVPLIVSLPASPRTHTLHTLASAELKTTKAMPLSSRSPLPACMEGRRTWREGVGQNEDVGSAQLTTCGHMFLGKQVTLQIHASWQVVNITFSWLTPY